ncbi:DUF4190 domain-containing protein [Sinomonas sp. JGH33]|uniref:DUF4190 domain-containing protein n=1 Tax=Sinomonas terricola TaxID=3110330 RepID=A0ABU5TC70_9MICC|nr:DUF4190 domain-containing protein [Sinomonas sp. JGH33]MEA5457255.1 DUF4190 domain-containing protein [Sinomonas sp. JGH33]
MSQPHQPQSEQSAHHAPVERNPHAYPDTQAPAYVPYSQQKTGTNALAIISLITSFFISIVGLILGVVALSQIKRTGEGGRGLAIAAIVIGSAGIAFGLLIITFGALAGNASTNY